MKTGSWWDRTFGGDDRFKGQPPRRLDPHDYSQFEKAAEAPKQTFATGVILQELRRKNPVRMRRLRKDFAWMQRQLKKMGLNPEDARWLL